MKRSEINQILKKSEIFLKEHLVFLPPFAQWMPVNWQNLDKSYQEITDNMLGWDVTDFGSGDFKRYGLVAFTFRNGNYKESEKVVEIYCVNSSNFHGYIEYNELLYWEQIRKY